MEKKDSSFVKHIVHQDGTVWRDAFCDCGKKIYKKCLTNGSIEFLTGHGGNLKQKIIQQGDASSITIECPSCNTGHIVAHINESMGINEKVVEKIVLEK